MKDIAIAILGSTALSSVITFVLTQVTKALDRKDTVSQLAHRMDKNEKDNVRLQMLFLMSNYPGNQKEIIEVAQHYFEDIGGNWYMTNMFNEWLTDNNVGQPEWFKGGKNE